MNKAMVQEKKHRPKSPFRDFSSGVFFALIYRENWQNLLGPVLKGYIQHTFTFLIFTESCVLFNAK